MRAEGWSEWGEGEWGREEWECKGGRKGDAHNIIKGSSGKDRPIVTHLCLDASVSRVRENKLWTV